MDEAKEEKKRAEKKERMRYHRRQERQREREGQKQERESTLDVPVIGFRCVPLYFKALVKFYHFQSELCGIPCISGHTGGFLEI